MPTGVYPRPSALERFTAAYIVVDSGCWIWKRGKAGDGYGQHNVDGKHVYAHRWAYEHYIGPIPAGYVIDHLCRVHACVNPWHIEAVLPIVNVQRGVGHGSEVSCPRGHAYDEANTRRYMGKRYCRACARAYQARVRAAA